MPDWTSPEPAASPGVVLALDIGDVRIGVALSDQERRIAVPLTTLSAAESWTSQVAALVVDNDAVLVVVGLPYSMSGERGPRADVVQSAVDDLASVLDVPITTHDERLSTVEAHRRLLEAGIRGRRQREVVDSMAAAVILEAFLARP